MASQSVDITTNNSSDKMSVKYAYVMYKLPCTNSGSKHPPKEVVPVSRIQKFRASNAIGREYIILCGNGLCAATIGLVGDSLTDVQQQMEESRVKFVASQLSRAPSDLSSSGESTVSKKVFKHVSDSKQKLASDKLRIIKTERIARENNGNRYKSETRETYTTRSEVPTKSAAPNQNVLPKKDQPTKTTVVKNAAGLKNGTQKKQQPKTIKNASPNQKDTPKESQLTQRSIVKTAAIIENGMEQEEQLEKTPVKKTVMAENGNTRKDSVNSEESESADDETAPSSDTDGALGRNDRYTKLEHLLNDGPPPNEGDNPHADNETTLLLKRKVIDLETENRALRALNLNLQKKLLCNAEKVEATIANVDDTARVNIQNRITLGKDMPVGFIDNTSNKIHAGLGIWIDCTEYDRLRLRRKLTPAIFIARVACLIYTDKVMRTSSVTGTISNAHKANNMGIAKPALNPTKLEAVMSISKYWMKKQKLSVKEIDHHLSFATMYISKKISDMNRPPKTDEQKKKTVKTKKASLPKENRPGNETEDNVDVEVEMDKDRSESQEKRKRLLSEKTSNDISIKSRKIRSTEDVKARTNKTTDGRVGDEVGEEYTEGQDTPAVKNAKQDQPAEDSRTLETESKRKESIRQDDVHVDVAGNEENITEDYLQQLAEDAEESSDDWLFNANSTPSEST